MKITVITLFPEVFPGTLGVSLPAKSMGVAWNLQVCNLRDYGIGIHKQVDDEVYGGGSGMLMRPDVIGNALDDCIKNSHKPHILLTSPRGFMHTQYSAQYFAESERDMIIICGRFEGVDFRLVEFYNITEISIGKFVLFGGEVAAMCIMESIIRLLDGVCGNSASLHEESYSPNTPFKNLMEYPQYTRPAIWNGLEVPTILRSGHHANIKSWQIQKAKQVTEFYNSRTNFIDIE
jgi:tRNA (guanine37-N1)-methyltransferase